MSTTGEPFHRVTRRFSPPTTLTHDRSRKDLPRWTGFVFNPLPLRPFVVTYGPGVATPQTVASINKHRRRR